MLARVRIGARDLVLPQPTAGIQIHIMLDERKPGLASEPHRGAREAAETVLPRQCMRDRERQNPR